MVQSFAQLSGEVSYTTTINMHKGLPDDERGKRMKEWLPETTEFQNLLLFTSEETVYKNIHEEEEETPDLDAAADGDGGRGAQWRSRMLKRMAPPNDIVYTDVLNGLVTQKKEFMDKVFLIKDTIEMSSWKLTGEMKEVGGMNCMKAEYIVPEKTEPDTMENMGFRRQFEVEQAFAWFSPEIAVASGPAGFGGLPGLIVHLNINDGGMTISMNSIVMREIEKGEIEAPTKGKEVTMEEFEEIKRKKMEQQRANYSGDGRHRH